MLLRVLLFGPAGQLLALRHHMVRVSIPTLPISAVAAPATILSAAAATERVVSFLAPGNTVVLTGAGVSVASGIRAYRGADGRYANPNYK